ncbi:hypothetical protein J6590_032851 [Homalodisca vitripennis]|nr:hypothetical protein J6590_032851 [Homalodisca vitripennis]
MEQSRPGLRSVQGRRRSTGYARAAQCRWASLSTGPRTHNPRCGLSRAVKSRVLCPVTTLLMCGGGESPTDRVKQVIALITGHGHFRKHLNTLGLRNEDSECRLCNKSEETAKHIILDCERLGARRRALFGDKQPGDEPDASIGEKLLSLIKGTKIGLPL